MEQIIVSGDVVNFLPPFGSAIITPIPGAMVGSATTVMTTSKPTCVEGDEKNVVVPGVPYINPPNVIPGVGILTIDKLASDQLSTKTTSGGKKVILKGVQFDAKFTVVTPAQKPTPAGPIPDTVTSFMGKGMFVNTNMTVTDMA